MFGSQTADKILEKRFGFISRKWFNFILFYLLINLNLPCYLKKIAALQHISLWLAWSQNQLSWFDLSYSTGTWTERYVFFVLKCCAFTNRIITSAQLAYINSAKQICWYCLSINHLFLLFETPEHTRVCVIWSVQLSILAQMPGSPKQYLHKNFVLSPQVFAPKIPLKKLFIINSRCALYKIAGSMQKTGTSNISCLLSNCKMVDTIYLRCATNTDWRGKHCCEMLKQVP